jgi:hypothetical protein
MRAGLLLVALGSPLLLPAQQYSPLAIGAEATSLRVVRDVATAQQFDGTVLGAGASARFGWLQLEGRYFEGSLTPSSVAADAEDLVDARVIARVGIAPWLAVGAGPHLRAFITPSGTARWSRVEVHARSEGELINGLAHLRVDLWVAPSASSNVQGGGTGAMGGEAGLLVRIPRSPVALELTYLADRATFTSSGSEFVEGIRVALVLDRILPARPAPASRSTSRRARAGSSTVTPTR